MANIKFSDLSGDPDTVLEVVADGDYILVYDISEALDTKKIKVSKYSAVVPKVHTLGVPVFHYLQELEVGDGKGYLPIPAAYDGYSLISAQASLTTVSSSELPTVQIYNLTTGKDMLTTRVTIDASEFTSYTAAANSVIDDDHKIVSTGDILRFDVDVAGTGAKGLTMILTFGKE